MPRDTIALLEAIPDLSTPSLEGLAYLLRHPEKWPEGFVWDYSDCHTCAVGLAMQLHDISGPGDETVSRYAARILCLPHGEAYDIFVGLGDDKGIDRGTMARITSIHVATAIEAYLANR